MVNVNYTAIGHRIKDKRKETGLMQKELAQKVGLSEASISKYEHGKVEDATHNMLIRFAEVLNVSVSWLLGIEEPPQIPVPSLSAEEKRLIHNFQRLNRTGKDYILQTMELALPFYAENPSNHEKLP